MYAGNKYSNRLSKADFQKTIGRLIDGFPQELGSGLNCTTM